MPRFCLHGSAMTRPGFKAALLHPRYWPMWFGLGLLWLIIQLPYRVLLLLGRVLGWLMYLFMRERREIARINLALCVPDWRVARRKTVLREDFASNGSARFERGRAGRAPTQLLWRPDRATRAG